MIGEYEFVVLKMPMKEKGRRAKCSCWRKCHHQMQSTKAAVQVLLERGQKASTTKHVLHCSPRVQESSLSFEVKDLHLAKGRSTVVRLQGTDAQDLKQAHGETKGDSNCTHKVCPLRYVS
jgi:hypothetical protein